MSDSCQYVHSVIHSKLSTNPCKLYNIDNIKGFYVRHHMWKLVNYKHMTVAFRTLLVCTILSCEASSLLQALKQAIKGFATTVKASCFSTA